MSSNEHCQNISLSFFQVSNAFIPNVYNFPILLLSLFWCIKEEIQNRFNIISEGIVKLFEQNSENVMKISWKIRKLWYFDVSLIFKKHFLTSWYENANEWVDDVIASQFPIPFVQRNDNNFIFQLWEC